MALLFLFLFLAGMLAYAAGHAYIRGHRHWALLLAALALFEASYGGAAEFLLGGN